MGTTDTHSLTGGSVERPASVAQVLDVVRLAVAEEAPLEVRGAGTKAGLGRPVQAARVLDLSGLSGIALYEPEELVLTAGAGTPLVEIEAALRANRQQFAFEPPDLGPLLGLPAGRQTLGGVVACNLSGPRRFKAGAARDHFLGVQAVSGRGEAFKAGGRVVKNVTGYDLPKLFAGSYGTLVAMTELTLKVLPAPETECTVLLLGLDDAAGTAALSRALQGPSEAAGAAHLPAWAAALSSLPDVAGAGGAVTAIRLEGFAASVAYRAERLRTELGAVAPMRILADGESAAFWREVRDVHPFVRRPDRVVWRLSVAPLDGPRAVAAIRRHVAADVLYDWAGGLVWLGLDPEADAAATVHGAVAGIGGHATLVRAPEPLRVHGDVFQPQPPALAALAARVKDSFDPRRVLNPGRMYPGI